MNNEAAFKAWLEQGGAQAENARNNRVSALRTIERKLRELDTPFDDLSAAWESDKFTSLRERLRRMQEDARDGGFDYRILMPDSERPHNRLSNWASWLGQYGRFLAGDPPGAAKDADRIRQYVLEQYIEPARELGQEKVEVRVSDVNTALQLNQGWANVCQALYGKKFRELAAVPPPERIGADMSPATVFRFDLSDSGVDKTALSLLRESFLAACPDFETFLAPGAGAAKTEKAYKRAASDRVMTAIATGDDDEALGKSVFEILKAAAKDGPFVRWQTEDSIVKTAPELIGQFYSIIGRLVRSEEATADSLSQAFTELEALKERGAMSLTNGERLNIVFSSLSMVRPHEVAPIKVMRINDAWVRLTGAKLFSETETNVAATYLRFAKVFTVLFDTMRDEWYWQPQDWFDIQGFLWIATEKASPRSEPEETRRLSVEPPKSAMNVSPTNLILYGPPGTGKTYATALEAVRLCGEQVDVDRVALMRTYHHLMATGRIEFVTFHQSTSYEDFVEGRQPVTGPDDDGEGASAGFRLETIPGLFRRIAKRAETSHGRATGPHAISATGRQIFKMSIGRSNVSDDARYFDEAIERGYAFLSWEDIDWTDNKYTDPAAILMACHEQGTHGGAVGPQSGQVKHTDVFRNELRTGDILVVSNGNSLFRAIGVVTGDYEYSPRPEGRFCHRRSVQWHWVDPQGVPAGEIYRTNFTQATIYKLGREGLNLNALERYLNSQHADGSSDRASFVLIIDEINRANISKVFGELITLLEADKRLGQPNALRVRLPYSGDDFGVPSNLHIVGTMNTADRSIALLDTALRRRFTFREMMPDPDALQSSANACGLNLPMMLRNINDRIEYLYDREHQIGHAYFTGCSSRADVDAVMRQKIIPLLAEYFFEDWSKIAAVLGDARGHEGPMIGGFLKRYPLKAPPGLEDGDALARFRWEIRSEDEGFDYTGLIGA